MDVQTTQVQAAVQQLVVVHGEYAPLELLLATNRLGYEDYRAWRECRLETLDAALTEGVRKIRTSLEVAQSWAEALGLTPEPAVHHGWEENSGTVLVASVDPPLNALLSTRFRHVREHAQLDLFIDSAQTAAVNTLLDALTARDAGKAREALARLVRTGRDHGQRFHASALISSLEASAPAGPERGLEQLERMEREWIPAASALLGARRRDFLAPLWRDIGLALPRALRPAPSRAPCDPGVPGGARLGAPEALGPRGAGIREGAGVARPARGGVLEAARPRRGHRVVVRFVSPCAGGVRAADRSGGLSGLGTAERVARRSGAGPGVRDDPGVVARLDVDRGARTRGRTGAAPPRRCSFARLRCGDGVACASESG